MTVKCGTWTKVRTGPDLVVRKAERTVSFPGIIQYPEEPESYSIVSDCSVHIKGYYTA